jgi:DNA-binding transcriptional LysR family regulator
MVLVADRDHPRVVDGQLSLADLAELPHAVPSFGPGVLTPVDRAFGEVGIDRHIALTVAGFLPLPFVIVGTEMVAMVPQKLALSHVLAGAPIVMVDPPFDEVVLAEGYWFGRDRLSDPAHRWLFARFDELAEELAKE